MSISKITYARFKKVFEYKFLLGVYPELDFEFNEKKYCINADLEKIYLTLKVPKPLTYTTIYEYKPLFSKSNLDELVNTASIDDQLLIDIWDDIVFQDYEDDYVHEFAYRDMVYIKSKNAYGSIFREIESNNGVNYQVCLSQEPPAFWKDKDMIICEENDLEYDYRDETIKKSRESYADYLYRISH
jgi:hypothetical protein